MCVCNILQIVHKCCENISGLSIDEHNWGEEKIYVCNILQIVHKCCEDISGLSIDEHNWGEEKMCVCNILQTLFLKRDYPNLKIIIIKISVMCCDQHNTELQRGENVYL